MLEFRSSVLAKSWTLTGRLTSSNRWNDHTRMKTYSAYFEKPLYFTKSRGKKNPNGKVDNTTPIFFH